MFAQLDLKTWWTALELAEAKLRGFPQTQQGATKQLTQFRRAVDTNGRQLGRKRQGGGWEYHYSVLPEALRVHLIMHHQRRQTATAPVVGNPAECAAPDAPQRVKRQWVVFNDATAKKQAVARERLTILHEVTALYLSGVPVRVAVLTVSLKHKVPTSTIYSWRRKTKGQNERDWLAFLVSGHKGRTATADCTAAAWEAYKADYMRLEEPPATACYERLCAMAVAHDWVVPSLKALQRRMAREVPESQQILARKGKKAAKAIYPAQERDRTDLHALEAVNADGHTLDVWVKWHDGEIIRPVATMIADLYSNKFLAWRIDKSESATAVRLAFHDLFRDWGIPDWALLDNGRAFASKQITGGQKTRFRFKVNPDENEGILTSLGIKVHWATPYSGQSKPIERNFRGVCDYIAKAPQFAGAYSGNSPTNKPGYSHNPQDKAVPFDTFMAVFDAGIQAFNARPGRRTAVCGGEMSFDAAFAASYAEVPIRKAHSAQLSMAMLTATKVTSRKPSGEVHLLGNRYWSEFLVEHIGAKLTLRFDPDNLHSGVKVCDEQGRFLGDAKALEIAGFHSVEAARTHGKSRRDYLRTLRDAEQIQNSMSLDDYLKLMPEAGEPAPIPETKTVRMVRVAGMGAGHASSAEDELDQPMEDFNFDALGRGLRLVAPKDEL